MKLNKQEFLNFIGTLKNMKNFANNLCKAVGATYIVLDDQLSMLYDLLVHLCGYKDNIPDDNCIIRYIFEDEYITDIYERVCEEVNRE